MIELYIVEVVFDSETVDQITVYATSYADAKSKAKTMWKRRNKDWTVDHWFRVLGVDGVRYEK